MHFDAYHSTALHFFGWGHHCNKTIVGNFWDTSVSMYPTQATRQIATFYRFMTVHWIRMTNNIKRMKFSSEMSIVIRVGYKL